MNLFAQWQTKHLRCRQNNSQQHNITTKPGAPGVDKTIRNNAILPLSQGRREPNVGPETAQM